MSNRQVVLDTETTGLDPKQGHRIIEIACLEIINRRLTGNTFHCYINPQRAVDEGAFKIHGLGDEFLQDKPLFNQIADEFFAFIKHSELIIHNAPFDVGFIDHEFHLLKPKLGRVTQVCKVLDTLSMARDRYPGQRNNLDALCKRYSVDNSARDLHGALIDTDLLAQVYLAMTSGQDSLFSDEQQISTQSKRQTVNNTSIDAKDLPVIKASDDEQAAHDAYMQSL